MPAVSVVATVLNEVEEIDRLVASLTGQTFAPAQVVIVDGGSRDGTWERLQDAQQKYPRLIPIRDESCRLEHCPGPIARGRNVAIAAATGEVVACADAGCGYDSDWLENLTAPIRNGDAEYAVGGSCLDADRTVWDVAAAPFLGVKLNVGAKTKSCTARSMAFRKELWLRVGGFPENLFFGEDTVFDQRARVLAAPAFVDRAKAFYRPRHSFSSAVKQLGSYAISDGVSGARPARLMRNLIRCVVEVLAVLLLGWSTIPLLCVLALEVYFAFRLDWRDLRGASVGTLAARLLFSLIVPWVVTWNHIAGRMTKTNRPNRQNLK
jgi:glycosyltransferase involved in cell wall biosynthesis